MTEKDVYKKGVALLEEWEDVNYCEHSFKFKDEWLTDKEVVDKLNELAEENNQLKSELENCRECLELNRESCARHMKENEQLKSQNRLLKGKLHRLRMEKGALEEEIECLGEETIEQFRKDLQNGEFMELTARPNVRKHPNDNIRWKGDVE